MNKKQGNHFKVSRTAAGCSLAGLVLCCMGISFLQGCDQTGQGQKELEPYTINHWKGNESRIDLSFLLNAPAGKRGYVMAKGEADTVYSGTGKWGKRRQFPGGRRMD